MGSLNLKIAGFSRLLRLIIVSSTTLLLPGCGTGTSPERVAAPPRSQPEPSVVTTTRHYAQLLTRATPLPADSLRHYQHRLAEPTPFPPDCYLLRLRTYSLRLELSPLATTVKLEPMARTDRENPRVPKPLPDSLRRPDGKIIIERPHRDINPALPVSLTELSAAFGAWQGDDFPRIEEPIEPDMHVTYFEYRNPTTGQRCAINVKLKNSPTDPTNVVHEVSLYRL